MRQRSEEGAVRFVGSNPQGKLIHYLDLVDRSHDAGTWRGCFRIANPLEGSTDGLGIERRPVVECYALPEVEYPGVLVRGLPAFGKLGHQLSRIGIAAHQILVYVAVGYRRHLVVGEDWRQTKSVGLGCVDKGCPGRRQGEREETCQSNELNEPLHSCLPPFRVVPVAAAEQEAEPERHMAAPPA